MSGFQFNFKVKTKAEAKAVVDREPFQMPTPVFEAVKQAVDALPDVPGKSVQVICHGNVEADRGNVNIMVSIVS